MSETFDDTEIAIAIEAIESLPLEERAQALADVENTLRGLLDSAPGNK